MATEGAVRHHTLPVMASALAFVDDTRHIDADQLALPFANLAGDEDRIDVTRIHHVGDRAWRIVDRPHRRVVGA